MIRKRRIAWLARALVVLHLALWLACGTDGERARTGECPSGEVCAPETPEGLVFTGQGTSDGFLATGFATAVGGTQSYGVRNRRLGGSLPPFIASSSDPSVIAVDHGGGSSVGLRALAPGSSLLRITNTNGELLDRTTLLTGEVDRLELRPMAFFTGLHPGPWAFRRGGSAAVVFALYDAGGARLVDDSARPVEEPGRVVPRGWDSADVELVAPGATIDLAIDLGAGRRVASAMLVDGIDRIERVDLGEPSLLELRPGGTTSVCFWAFLGERAVAGVSYDLEASGPIAVTPDGSGPQVIQCASVEALDQGEAMILVRAEGIELREPVHVR